jgi:ribosomal protein S18 acetylase RimI-like enzyme
MRRLRPEDAPAYRDLMLEAYTAHPDAFTSSPSERQILPMAWWEDRLSTDAHANECVFGAFVASQLVGVAGLSFQTREKLRHKCSVFGMYVRPSHRGHQLGDGLLGAVLKAARQQRGVSLAQLTVTQGNRAAVALYERHGFVAFGVEPQAVVAPSGAVTKLHMWLPLRD